MHCPVYKNFYEPFGYCPGQLWGRVYEIESGQYRGYRVGSSVGGVTFPSPETTGKRTSFKDSSSNTWRPRREGE